MKTILTILCLFPIISFSQSLGVKVGGSFCNIPGFDVLKGSNIGLLYSYGKGKVKGSIEPSYHVKGYGQIIAFANKPEYEKARVTYSFIEVPFTIGYFPFNDKFILGIQAGLVPSFLIDSRTRLTGYNIKNEDARSFNIDAIVGIKVGVYLSNNIFLTLNSRFGNGLLNIDKVGRDFTYQYLNTFLELGYKF
jgi:hypothetical protein